MLKHHTFLALALVGGALLFVDQDTTRCDRTSKVVWIAEHPPVPQPERQLLRTRLQAGDISFDPAMTSAPTLVRTRIVVVTNGAGALSLRSRFAELQTRVRASIATFQAEECCWLNSLGQNLHGKSSSGNSPAWRDLHYDAQALARMLGLCKQEPV